MSSRPIGKSSGPRDGFGAQRGHSVAQFIGDRLCERQRPLFIGARSITQHRRLRERRDLLAQFDGNCTRLAWLADPRHQPHRSRLLGRNATSGEEHVERVAHADEPRQSNGSAIDQRHPPPPAEDTENRVGRGDTEIAPASQLETAGDGVSFHSSDDGFGEHHATRSHRPFAIGRDAVESANRYRLEVRPGTKRPAGPGEHGDAGRFVGLKCDERVDKCLGGSAIDGVAPGRAIDGDDRHRAVAFDVHDRVGVRVGVVDSIVVDRCVHVLSAAAMGDATVADDLAGLQQRVREHLHEAGAGSEAGGVEAVTVRPLPGGACQDNFVVEATWIDGTKGRLVLRSDARSSLLGSVPRRVEAPVIAAAVAAGVNTPPALWPAVGLVAPGASAYFMPWVTGVAIGRKVVASPKLDNARAGLIDTLAPQLAAIHSINPTSHPDLFDGATPQRSAADQAVADLDSYLDRLPTDRPALLFIGDWLRENRPDEDHHVLVHGDFRTGNFMVDATGLQGILDWEFAHWGSRCEDLSWICVRDWRFGVLNNPVGGFGQRARWLSVYESTTKMAIDPAHLHWWEVMGNARWAIGAVQQSERYLSGKERDLEYLAIGRRTVEMEWEALRLIRTGVPRWRAENPAD